MKKQTGLARILCCVLIMLTMVGAMSIMCVSVQAEVPVSLQTMYDVVLSGDLDVYDDYGNEVKMPVNTRMSTSACYWIYSKTTGARHGGYQCYIYAQAVYNVIFKEWPGNAKSGFSHSHIVLSGGNSVSYNRLKEAGVRNGAYVRTTIHSDGAYDPDYGHSLIIMSYDSNNITYLEGNGDGNGIIRKVTVSWSEFNSRQLSGRGRYVSHIVQPLDSYYDNLYPSDSDIFEDDDAPNEVVFSNMKSPEMVSNENNHWHIPDGMDKTNVMYRGNNFTFGGTITTTASRIGAVMISVFDYETNECVTGENFYFDDGLIHKSVDIATTKFNTELGYKTISEVVQLNKLDCGKYYIRYGILDGRDCYFYYDTDPFVVVLFPTQAMPTVTVNSNNHVFVKWEACRHTTYYHIIAYTTHSNGELHQRIIDLDTNDTYVDLGFFEGGTYKLIVASYNYIEGFYNGNNWSEYIQFTVPQHKHIPGAAATCTAAQTCTTCGAVVKDKLGHSYNTVVTAPTCIEDGYTTHTCTRCGDSYTDSKVSAKGHTPGSAANCTTAQTCITCGTIISGKLNHNYTNQVTAPTCTASGYTAHTCIHCGDTYKDNEIPSKGHTPVVLPGVYPTPETEGLTEGSVCQECGDILIPQEPIPKQDIITGSVNAGGVTIFFTINFVTGDMTIQGDGTGEMGNFTGICNDREFIWYKYEKYIKRIIVEKSVTSVGDYAFFGLSTLKEVVLPDGVTYIGFAAFSGCSSLVSITIPSTVTRIDEAAFCNCSSLTSIELPQNVLILSSSMFYGCNNLKNIMLPSDLTEIGGYVFYKCTSLESIKIPQNVKTIGDSAFMECSNLKTVVLKEGLESIGRDAFGKCYSLKSINIPNGVIRIDAWAFSFCYGLTSIDIPETVTYIGDNAFSDCGNLTSITIPAGVIAVNHYTFNGCYSLKSVTLPASVKSIGISAFYNCEDLTDVYFYGLNEEWNSISINDGNDSLREATIHFVCIHDYTITVTAPTCTAEGYTTHTCTRCGDSYVDSKAPAKGHTPGTAATCTSNQTCTTCGAIVNNKLGHSYNTVVTAPTCTAEGYTTHTCTRCGDSYVDSKVPAKGHTSTVIPAIPATCTDLGKTEGSKCSICGEILVKQNTVAPLGHTETAIPAKEATCTEAGLTAGTRCEACGDTLISQKEIPAKGHAEIIDPAKAPTCTATGLTEGKHCSTCGEILVAQTEVAATGHTLGDWTITVEPAIGTEGKKQQACTACGEVLNEEVIPALPEETEPVTDPVTEPDMDPETQPETETTPVTETPTEAPSDDPAITEEPTAEESSTTPTVTGGCSGSILSCGLLMLIALAGAALLKRKE